MILRAASAAPFQRRVLAVGPGEGFITGQSVAFMTYTRKSSHIISIVNTNDEGMSFAAHAASSIRVIIQSAWHILFRRPECVYLSTSRSKLGAIKDISVIALARSRSVPVVNHLHGSTFVSFRDSLGTLYGGIVDWAYRYIAASIVLHEILIPQYSKYPQMTVSVVNNFVDADVASTVKSDREIVGPINVLFLSNLMPEKGVFELIESVKSLLSQSDGAINLKIAGRFLPGGGMSSREVEARLSQSIAGIPQIEYCGFADATTKKRLLAWAHVLALPSYMKEEAIPLAVLEGMAAGCYLIVSDFGILPHLVKDVVAAVVPAGNIAALENALAAVMADRRVLLDAALLNPQVAKANYSEAQYISGVDGIIGEVSLEAVR